jgi:hypothetical protein
VFNELLEHELVFDASTHMFPKPFLSGRPEFVHCHVSVNMLLQICREYLRGGIRQAYWTVVGWLFSGAFLVDQDDFSLFPTFWNMLFCDRAVYDSYESLGSAGAGFEDAIGHFVGTRSRRWAFPLEQATNAGHGGWDNWFGGDGREGRNPFRSLVYDITERVFPSFLKDSLGIVCRESGFGVLLTAVDYPFHHLPVVPVVLIDLLPLAVGANASFQSTGYVVATLKHVLALAAQLILYLLIFFFPN